MNASLLQLAPVGGEQTQGAIEPSGILGTGSALPKREVTNDDLESFLDTTDEWIRARVGIERRYICGPEETTFSLAAEASRKAIEAAGIAPEEIDLVVVGSVTSDSALPSTAARLLGALEIPPVMAFDLQAACSGFLFGLVSADALLQSLGKRTALVIGAENLSRIVDWSDRNTCVLFADGAGAAIYRRPTEQVGGEQLGARVLASSLATDASGIDLIRRPGSSFPKATFPLSDPIRNDDPSPYVHMEGREVFRFGVKAMSQSIVDVLAKSGRSIEDINLFIPHQSNKRMIDAVCDRVGLSDRSRLVLNLESVGNTSAASIPIALDWSVREERLKKGDLVLMTAVGSGMTYGSVLLEW